MVCASVIVYSQNMWAFAYPNKFLNSLWFHCCVLRIEIACGGDMI